MGAIFFYIFVFFVSYYSMNVLNMLTVRPLITNRYIAALFPVYGIAIAHAYMISTKPLPPGKDVTIESALLEFVAIPVIVVTLGAIYFMWNDKGNQEEHGAVAEHIDTDSATTLATSSEQQSTSALSETEAPVTEKEKSKNNESN